MNHTDSSLPISGLDLSYFNRHCGVARPPEHGSCVPIDSQVGRDEDCQKSAAWSKFIQGQLSDWRRNQRQLEDDDIEAPSAGTIDKATAVAISMRDRGLPPPDRIVPTGDGGIALQFDRDNEFISIEVEPEGLVELLVFCDGRFTHRAAI